MHKKKNNLELIALSILVLFGLFASTQAISATASAENDSYPPPAETSVPYPTPDTDDTNPYPSPDDSAPYPPPSTDEPQPYPPPGTDDPQPSPTPVTGDPQPYLPPPPDEPVRYLPPVYPPYEPSPYPVAITAAPTKPAPTNNFINLGLLRKTNVLTNQADTHTSSLGAGLAEFSEPADQASAPLTISAGGIDWHWWQYHGLDREQARLLPLVEQQRLKAIALCANQPAGWANGMRDGGWYWCEILSGDQTGS